MRSTSSTPTKRKNRKNSVIGVKNPTYFLWEKSVYFVQSHITVHVDCVNCEQLSNDWIFNKMLYSSCSGKQIPLTVFVIVINSRLSEQK